MSEFPMCARIVVSFRSFWTSGTGKGSGRQSDVRCHRDRRDLPALPMSQIKGTLRETAELLAENNVPGITRERVTLLFGGRTEPDNEDEPNPSVLSVSEDAIIAADVAALIKGREATLFHNVAATALSEEGVAEDKTLRTIEVAVPVALVGHFQWIGATSPKFDWIDCLDRIAAATPAFGKGKFDGYGRAVARVEPDNSHVATNGNSDSEGTEIPAGAFDIDLTLIPTRNAVFSGRPATEGSHTTLRSPTGAALLGWCVQTAGYLGISGASTGMKDPLSVYHSGAVSFGNASPTGSCLTEEVVPVPGTFAVPKGREQAAISAEGALDPEVVRNGRPPEQEDDDTQYVAVRSQMMTTGFSIVSSQTGQRLRTATRKGRAATGQLFGLQHLAGGNGDAYCARISIDASVDREDARRILGAFDGQKLVIGKARNTGYGGAFDCRAQIVLPVDEQLDPRFSGPVRVLALSDVAAVDAFGGAASILDPADLGLDGARFDPLASSIRYRRYAPWNGALGCRDTERLVIVAGSVLAYDVPELDDHVNIRSRQRVGAWQEVGLGSVWLDPPFLRDWRLPSVERTEDTSETAEGTALPSEQDFATPPVIDREARPEEASLIDWVNSRTETQVQEEGK